MTSTAQETTTLPTSRAPTASLRAPARAAKYAAALLIAVAGCSRAEAPPARVPFAPPTAEMHRLTDARWRNAAEDLLGVRFAGALPPDLRLHGYTSVGAGALAISPLDVEQYEGAAWTVAAQAVPTAAAAEARFGCEIDDPSLGEACVRSGLVALAEAAWRRPVGLDELDRLHALWRRVHADLGPLLATHAAIAAIMIAPDFLFDVTIGVADLDDPDARRLTDEELAVRLAFALTDRPPDAELRAAARAGALRTDEQVRAQAVRLLGTADARVAVARFFTDTLDLDDDSPKDRAQFPAWTAAAQAGAREDLRMLFDDVVFTRDVDYREILTTDRAWVSPGLDAIYGLEPVFAPEWATISADRGGLLGRPGFLAREAHRTVTSPTRRGKFVQTRLLCRSIPPPPDGAVAIVDDAPGDVSMRERMSQHATDPVCASCHEKMDPIGFALEHYDAIGAWQADDNGYPIDATGHLDDVPFDGAAELARVVADHPELPACTALNAYRWATAQAEGEEDLELIGLLADDLLAADGRLQALLVELVASSGFRTVTAPAGAPADVAPERCNRVDDDGDGVTDLLFRTCADGPGVETCADGAWSACVPPGAVEVCDGADNDADGAIDDLPVETATVAWADLRADGCDPAASITDLACRTAADARCVARGCAIGGLGIVASDPLAETATLACVSSALATPVTTTFTALDAYTLCDASAPESLGCHAAVAAVCAEAGLTSGAGPVGVVGDEVRAVCLPGAVRVDPTFDDLVPYAPGCTGWSAPGCEAAYHGYCRAAGALTGVGPLDVQGTTASGVCIGGE